MSYISIALIEINQLVMAIFPKSYDHWFTTNEILLQFYYQDGGSKREYFYWKFVK